MTLLVFSFVYVWDVVLLLDSQEESVPLHNCKMDSLIEELQKRIRAASAQLVSRKFRSHGTRTCMQAMQQTHVQVCTCAYISKKFSERSQEECKQTVHGSAAYIVSRPLLAPTVGCYPQAKNCTPKFSCKKNNNAEFACTLWPRVYVTTGALSSIVVETKSHWSGSGSTMDMILQWQSQ